MRGHADRLVDHDEVVVVVHDREAGDEHRHDRRLASSEPLHLEPAARAHPVRLAERRPSRRTPPASTISAAKVREKPSRRASGGVGAFPREPVRRPEGGR